MRFYLPIFLALLSFFTPSFLSAQQEQIAEPIMLIRKSFVKDNPKAQFRMDVSYPEAQGTSYSKQHGFNICVQKMMTESVNQFKSKMRKIEEETSSSMRASLVLDYVIIHQCAEYVSIKFEEKTNFGTPQSQEKRIITINYNLKENKNIKPKEVFSEEINIPKLLMEILQDKATDFKPDHNRLFKKFALTDDFITFYFDESNSNQTEIKEISLPWKAIEHLRANKDTTQID